MGKFIYRTTAKNEIEARDLAKKSMGRELRTRTKTRVASNIRITGAVFDPETALWTISGTHTSEVSNE